MRTEGTALLMALLGAGPAVAETSPYYIGGSISAAHDSNVFRSADAPIGDTTLSAGVVGGFDQRIGRQRVYANGSINADRHVRLGRLDDTSYALAAGLDWSTVRQLSGTLHYATQRGLADYGVANVPATTEKNLLHTQQLGATVSWPMLSDIALDASLDHHSVRYSAEAYRSLAFTQDVAGAAFRWRPGPLLGLSVGARSTRGKTPQFEVAPGDFEPDRQRRGDIDLATTLAGPRSSFNARVSFTHESHSQPSNPGLSGLTGAVDVDYALTARLRLAASASRDTGTATTFLRFGTATGINVDTNRISTQWRASLNWAATSKISAGVLARYNRGETSSLFGAADDRIESYALQGDWSPVATAKLSCSVSRELRDSTTGTGYRSRATVAGCAAQMSVR